MFVQGSQELEARMEKQASGASGEKDPEPVVTITISRNSDGAAIDVNDENDIRKHREPSNGFPNQAFEPSPPTAPPLDERGHLMPNTPLCNDASPSVDGGEQARNAAENKDHAYEIVAKT